MTQADSRENKDEALRLGEQYADFMLADALDGKVNREDDLAAALALSITDVPALRKLVKKRKRKFQFVEADVATKGMNFSDDPKLVHGPKPKGKTALEKRIKVLKSTPGTRMAARMAYNELAKSDDPFEGGLTDE